MDRQTEAVSKNQDKASTYQTLLNRYNTAVKDKFYFEALLI